MKAGDILTQAKDLIEGDRAVQHGDMHALHITIARFWSIYIKRKKKLSARDVCIMMALLKISRTMHGTYNVDDLRDAAAYLAMAEQVRQ